MENLVVALSNLPVVFPVRTAVKNRDYLTAGTIAFVGSASFISHLVENHKHRMPGFLKVRPRTSWIWNRLDVLGCALTFGRLSYLYYTKTGLKLPANCDLILILTGLALSAYSEHDYNLKRSYIITHSLWHLIAFTMMNGLLIDYIYKN